jgi:hypothetical protein
VREAAAELDIGDLVGFVPQAADPKDLFALLRPPAGAPLRPERARREAAVA